MTMYSILLNGRLISKAQEKFEIVQEKYYEIGDKEKFDEIDKEKIDNCHCWALIFRNV